MNNLQVNIQEHLSAEWAWFLVRGLLAVAFGVIAFIWPFATIYVLAVFWGAFVFVDGLFAIVSGWRLHKKGVRWWPYLIFGLVGMLAGLFAFFWPGITAMILVYLIAFWAIAGGLALVWAAIYLRREMKGEWVLALSGVVSVIFGGLIVFAPGAGMVATAWIIGAYAIFFGAFAVTLGLRLRPLKKVT